MRAPPPWHTWTYAGLVVALCLGGSAAISVAVDLPKHDEFNVVRWELQHVPNKWLYLTGRLLGRELSRSEEDERLARYLEITGSIGELSGDDTPDRAAIGRLRSQREEIENDVESIIEGRLTAVLQEAGLDSSLPLFPDARWVFPPVDVEFDQPPAVLAVSRRDRIELVHRQPLRPGFSRDDAVARERAVEEDGALSALVLSIGGAATYPSIVAPQDTYAGLVDTVAHEWVHHYLFFKPLGRRVLESEELRTLNETVANLAAAGLAALVVERYPLPEAAAARAPSSPAVDVGAALRALRLAVDTLLARGRIEEAEALMEQTRLELAGQGVFFRRINQAYFAFANVYADRPASTDPLGEQLRELREASGSVGGFLRAAGQLRSAADLRALLARER